MDNKQRDRLFNLSPTHRIAFAASCAERLFPNYVAFSRDAIWGNPQQLREALDAVWSHLLGNPLTPSATRKLIKQCELFVPDTSVLPIIKIRSNRRRSIARVCGNAV